MFKKISSSTAKSALLGVLVSLSFGVTAAPDGQDIMLVVDNSGSMHKIDPGFTLRESIERYAREAKEQQQLGIVVFDKNAVLTVPLAPHATPPDGPLLDQLNAINYHGRYTNTAAGIERAIYELKSHGRSGSERAVIVLTDGVIDTGDKTRNTESTRWLHDELAQDAARNNIPIFTIALGENADYQLLHSLAETTHGTYIRADKAGDITPAFQQINTALQHIAEPVPPPESAPQVAQPREQAPVAAPTPAETVKFAAPEEKPMPVEQHPAPEPDLHRVLQAAPPIAAAEPERTATLPGANWLQSLPPFENFPYQWLIGLSLALAAIELGLYLRRRRLRNNKPTTPPVVYTKAELPDNLLPEVYLEDRSGVLGKDKIRLSRSCTHIGRQHLEDNPDVDEMIIPSATIGRQHATIQYRDHDFWLSDRRSRNGTYVNGNRINDTVCLKHGDIIRFHDFEFRFILGYLADSDETVLAGGWNRWSATPKLGESPTLAPTVAQTMAIDKLDPSESRTVAQLNEPAEAQTQAAKPTGPQKQKVLGAEEGIKFDDITLPSDETVERALHKYFDATNF